MNRRGFLKRFGKGAAATVLMPSVLAIETPPIVQGETAVQIGNTGLFEQLKHANTVKYDTKLTYDAIKKVVEEVFQESWEEKWSDGNTYLPREWQDNERRFVFYGGREQVNKVAALL